MLAHHSQLLRNASSAYLPTIGNVRGPQTVFPLAPNNVALQHIQLPSQAGRLCVSLGLLLPHLLQKCT